VTCVRTFVALVLVAGCGGTPSGEISGIRLTLDGVDPMVFAPGEQRLITVRASRPDKGPLAGQSVELKLDGTTDGAKVEPTAVTTDATGSARVTLTAGTEGTFHLFASTRGGATWTQRAIIVDPKLTVRLQVTVQHQSFALSTLPAEVELQLVDGDINCDRCIRSTDRVPDSRRGGCYPWSG